MDDNKCNNKCDIILEKIDNHEQRIKETENKLLKIEKMNIKYDFVLSEIKKNQMEQLNSYKKYRHLYTKVYKCVYIN